MSAQGGTLERRGTIELPIWPIAVLVVAALAAAIGMTLLRSAGETRFVTSVTESERFENSTAAVREQGAVAPAIPAIRPIDLSVLENSSAVVREQGAMLPATVGISHVAPSLHSQGFAGFENPGAYVIGEVSAVAGPATGPSTGIMANGEMCHQCR